MTTAAASGNALLDAHVRLIRDAADLDRGRPASPAWPSAPSQDEIVIQVPQAIGDAAVPGQRGSPGSRT